jgi:hypothetical protein
MTCSTRGTEGVYKRARGPAFWPSGRSIAAAAFRFPTSNTNLRPQPNKLITEDSAVSNLCCIPVTNCFKSCWPCPISAPFLSHTDSEAIGREQVPNAVTIGNDGCGNLCRPRVRVPGLNSLQIRAVPVPEARQPRSSVQYQAYRRSVTVPHETAGRGRALSIQSAMGTMLMERGVWK